MRIGGLPTNGVARESDRCGRSGLKGCPALGRGLDFPLLDRACGGEEGTTLGRRPGGTLRHRQSQLNPVPRSGPDRPHHREVAALVGHDADRVNGVQKRSCEGRPCDEYADKGQENGSRHEPFLVLFDGLDRHGMRFFLLMCLSTCFFVCGLVWEKALVSRLTLL